MEEAVNWTTPAGIKKQLHRLWDRGKLLSTLMESNELFPYRVALKGPASIETVDEFPAVRQWIDDLRKGETKGYRIVWREINHRIIGRNSLPKEIWIDSLDTALAWIGKLDDARRFKTILAETRHRHSALLPWLARYPLRALELADVWTSILDVITWFQNHQFPGIYLRQIDIPGLHTKFIETHRGVLSELLDLALQPEAVKKEYTGIAGFCRRYGFRDKPLRIRFRILDPKQSIFPTEDGQDITINHNAFSCLNLPAQSVFITENETNYLAFPQLPGSMVIFGAGYGFDMLAEAHWLHKRHLYYWGDIDTHGFAILDQLRALFPHVQSLLMDRRTLLDHRLHWVTEPQPENRDLPRLTDPENQLYDDLRCNRLGEHVRLEQERISFSWVEHILRSIGQL
jgi:hypothetical protein